MKQNTISCDIIRDLLPLYVDNCCSKDSKVLVEAHIKECEKCQKEHNLFQTPLTTSHEEPDVYKIKEGIQKFKLIRTAGVIALALCLVLIFIVAPAINYTVGSSITYSNLNDLHTANQFVDALISGNYDEAYSYLDIEGKYYSLLHTDYGPRQDDDTLAVIRGIEEISTYGFDWYNKTAKDKFMNNMKVLEESGSTIATYSYRSIDRHGEKDSWCICYNATFENSLPLHLYLYIKDQKITSFSISMQDSQRIDELNLSKYYHEIDDYLSVYYQMPTLNETICEILYNKTSYDWTALFTRDIDVNTLFDFE